MCDKVGQCSRCKTHPREIGSRCVRCNDYHKAQRERCDELGLCRSCNQPHDGATKTCRKCLDRAKLSRLKRMKRGQCTSCQSPAQPGAVRCLRCLNRELERGGRQPRQRKLNRQPRTPTGHQSDLFINTTVRDDIVQRHAGKPKIRPGCAYILWCKDRSEVKVGRTKRDPSIRARATSRPWEIWRVWCAVECVDAGALENCIHEELASLVVTHPECGNREFFSATPETVEDMMRDYAERIDATLTRLRVVS